MGKIEHDVLTYDVSEDYKKQVEKIIESRSSEVLKNYSFGHAAYLSERMFEKTESSARLLTGRLCPREDDVMRGAFESMVRRLHGKGLKDAVRVITTFPEDLQEWLVALQKDTGNTLRIRRRDMPVDANINHFFVMDEDMYRLEQPHKPDNYDVKADVCFHDRETSKVLASAFDRVWQKLES
ncbi:MAG: hypothetical protein KJ626_15075 [Verrucomicrobia bacterium]|nr:hypothetical protein [Verrucomicrobiota bacterium]